MLTLGAHFRCHNLQDKSSNAINNDRFNLVSVGVNTTVPINNNRAMITMISILLFIMQFPHTDPALCGAAVYSRA